MTEYDNVNHPYHYANSGIECIDVMENIFGSDKVQSFCLCNAFKYIFRCMHKNNTIEDLKKADWYIKKFIELNEKEQNTKHET